jgi:hypothetical protein
MHKIREKNSHSPISSSRLTLAPFTVTLVGSPVAGGRLSTALARIVNYCNYIKRCTKIKECNIHGAQILTFFIFCAGGWCVGVRRSYFSYLHPAFATAAQSE